MITVDHDNGKEQATREPPNSDNKKFYAHLHDFGLLLEICMKMCIPLRATIVGQAQKEKVQGKVCAGLPYLT